MMELQDAARRMGELGLSIFPCKPGEKVPATPRGFKDATADLAQIESWWNENPLFNIGLPTGEVNGLFVVDVDGEFNQWPNDADKAASLMSGIVVKTPRGGKHFYFALDKQRPNTAGKLAPYVDTRGDGGYVLAPPSIVDDKPYSFIVGAFE
ncbi:MAG: bifunctional DNA primase/polymerase [Pirellulaceae bacterium]